MSSLHGTEIALLKCLLCDRPNSAVVVDPQREDKQVTALCARCVQAGVMAWAKAGSPAWAELKRQHEDRKAFESGFLGGDDGDGRGLE